MAQTIAVDFDGVIHAYSKGWQDGTIYDPPVIGAFQALMDLMAKYAVVIFTSREPEQVKPWLEEQFGFNVALDGDPEVQFWNHQGQLLVTNRKLPALAYIDDRGIRFETWHQTLADVETLHG